MGAFQDTIWLSDDSQPEIVGPLYVSSGNYSSITVTRGISVTRDLARESRRQRLFGSLSCWANGWLPYGFRLGRKNGRVAFFRVY